MCICAQSVYGNVFVDNAFEQNSFVHSDFGGNVVGVMYLFVCLCICI